MIALLTLAALAASALAGRVALRRGHPVELVMANVMLGFGLIFQIAMAGSQP